MIEIFIVREEGNIIFFKGSGHANYAEKGKDIICAAVSVSMQQAVLGIIKYLKVKFEPEINDGFLSADLKKIEKQIYSKRKEVNAILESMYLMLREIETQYPKHVKLIVKEAKKDV